jgi:hypothetical protein
MNMVLNISLVWNLNSNISCGWDFPTFTDIRNGDHLKLGGWSSLVAETDFFDSMDVSDKRREKNVYIVLYGL